MFSLNNIFKSVNVLNTVNIESDLVEVIIFPGKIGVTTIEGKYLFKNNISNDLYVCAEDALHILSKKVLTTDKENVKQLTKEMKKSIRNILNLNDIITQLSNDGACQVVIQRDISDQLPSTFVPLTVILGRLFQCMHLIVDNKTKLELSTFISTCNTKISEYYPKLSMTNNVNQPLNTNRKAFRRMSLQDLKRPDLYRSQTAPVTPVTAPNISTKTKFFSKVPSLALDKVIEQNVLTIEKPTDSQITKPKLSLSQPNEDTDYYEDLQPTIVRTNSYKISPSDSNRDELLNDDREVLIFSDDDYDSSDSDNNFDEITTSNNTSEKSKGKTNDNKDQVNIGSRHYYIVDKRLIDHVEKQTAYKPKQDLSEQFCGSTPRLRKLNDTATAITNSDVNRSESHESSCSWILSSSNNEQEDESKYANYIEEQDTDDDTEIDANNQETKLNVISKPHHRILHRKSFPSMESMDDLETSPRHWSASACTSISPSVSNTVKRFFTSDQSSSLSSSRSSSRLKSRSDSQTDSRIDSNVTDVNYYFSADELPSTPKGLERITDESKKIHGNRDVSSKANNKFDKRRKSGTFVYSSNVTKWTVYNNNVKTNLTIDTSK